VTVSADFREAMAGLASAVYVVTTRDEAGRPRGFTATSVLPHGFDPPSVIVSIDHAAFSHDAVTTGTHFGLNLLSAHQQHVSELFASKRADKFDKTAWTGVDERVPLLSSALGSAVCKVETTITHADHTIVVGVIETATMTDGEPLVYWQRHYHPDYTAPRSHDTHQPTTRRTDMPSVARPSREQVLASVKEMLPAVRSRANAAEVERSVSPETIADLKAAGLFKLFQPERYGGYAMDWGIQVEIARSLGSACGSTAWLLTVLSTHSAMVGRFALEAQDDVWGGDPEALIATGSARVGGGATPVEGGYMLDGAWRFSSGIDFSEWVMVAAPVAGVDAPPPAGLRQFLIPAADYEVIDDWHVSGLRGSGSKQVKIAEPLFIPEHRTLGFLELLGVNPPGAEVNDPARTGARYR
jgi:flavin reductase (DIM6/NTAB) family NADH-FMN oxidoreductase RutF